MTCFLLAALVAAGCAPRREAPVYDLVLRGGTIYDGRGGPPFEGDVAVDGERIAALGELGPARGRREVDVTGLAVTPGFVNMLSWSNEYLLIDGRAEAVVRQGVTLEVFGEGRSMGPLSEAMKEELQTGQEYGVDYEVAWTTLGEYLDHLAGRGVSVNVASFVGASTVREHVLGKEARAPSASELEAMQDLVRQAMAEGALGVGSALIYVPGTYASTGELIALARAAGEYGGTYISHLRNEGKHFPEAVDELLTVAREAGVAAEVYHLKAAGQKDWAKLEPVIAKIEAARAEGLRITANVYPYTATASTLRTTIPPWVRAGGHREMVKRLKDPALRARILRDMAAPSDEWESNLTRVTSYDEVLFVAFENQALWPLMGKTLTEVMQERGTTAEETIVDLLAEEEIGPVGVSFFILSEENLRKKVVLPWVSLGSDAGAIPHEKAFLELAVHPRTYGTFARFLGRYVRDEGLIPLEEAIRRLTSRPAESLGLEGRGTLTAGHQADVVVFDPATIRDNATFHDCHRFATGVRHVLVNGTFVVEDGEHTGALSGQVVRGPGWTG